MPLPTFLIIGERRSGTTSLAKWLEPHPDVYMHPKVDMAYFVDDAVVGRMDWFDGEVDESQWDQNHSAQEYSALFAASGSKIAIGEKSADYLFWRPAHSRMARLLPDAKFIATLRDPVERAWSHYWNEVGKGREVLSFEDAIAAEPDRIRRSAYARDHLSYCTRGHYDESLGDLFQTIPPEKVLVVTLEELKSSPQATLQKVFGFIGVDAKRGSERAGVRYNANWTTIQRGWARYPVIGWVERGVAALVGRAVRLASRDTYRRRDLQRRALSVFRETKDDKRMADDTRRMLQDRFAPHIAAAGRMLGRDFQEWSLSNGDREATSQNRVPTS
jgi:hypothetical protein